MNTVDTPYEVVKRLIVEGKLAPGEPLIEVALASKLHVSRTPIREAFNRLEQDGLVERTSRGLVVRARSPEEIFDIYEARIELEAVVAHAAAERRTEHDLRLLWRLVEHSPGGSETGDERVQLNLEFHKGMWRASHNGALADLLARLNLQLGRRYPATTLLFPGRWEVALEEHAALVDAVERRDAGAARELALTHFTEARDIRLKLWLSDVR